MILPEAKMHSKKYEQIWILPIVCEKPTESFVVIYGKENDYALCSTELDFFKFKQAPTSSDNPEFSEIINTLCKKYAIKFYQDWEDFNANYDLNDISTCRQNVQVNPDTKEITYELDEIFKTTSRYVFDKELGEIVYEAYHRLDDEAYLEEIEQKFNIIDSKILWNIRNQIKTKVFKK